MNILLEPVKIQQLIRNCESCSEVKVVHSQVLGENNGFGLVEIELENDTILVEWGQGDLGAECRVHIGNETFEYVNTEDICALARNYYSGDFAVRNSWWAGTCVEIRANDEIYKSEAYRRPR